MRLLRIALLVVGVAAAALLGSGVRVAEAAPDVTIVDRDGNSPTFHLCSVGLNPADGGSAAMVDDAIAMFTSLAIQPGYAGFSQLLAAPGAANLAGVTNCIAGLGAAAPGDVAVFFISSHGGRPAVADLNLDEPQNEPINLKPGNLNALGPPTDETILLAGGAQITDDQFAQLWLAPNLNLNPGVQVVAIFDHCHAGGHADGTTDLGTVLPNERALLMGSEAQYLCYEYGPGTLNPYGPRAFGPNGNGAFTLYLLEGLELVITGQPCVGGMTTRADVSLGNFGQPVGNNDCVTTAAELFYYAAQRTAFLVGDDDKNGGVDNNPADPNVDADAPQDGAWPPAVPALAPEVGLECRNVVNDDPGGDNVVNDGCGDKVAEDPPSFEHPGALVLGRNDDRDKKTDEDGVGTGDAGRCVSACPPDCTQPNAPDVCRQYPQLFDFEGAVADADGDGTTSVQDPDDDGDGFADPKELYMATDHLAPCPTSVGHDAWPPDRNGDSDADIGDVIQAFSGKIFNPPNYDARSDPDADGDTDIGDVIQLYGMGKILTRCMAVTYNNITGMPVDGLHVVFSAPVAAVFSARDSEFAGWSERALSGGGTILDLGRPDGLGDLANAGTLTVVIQTPMMTPTIMSCEWRLDGAFQGMCY